MMMMTFKLWYLIGYANAGSWQLFCDDYFLYQIGIICIQLYSLDLKEVEEDLKDSSSVIDSLISLYKNTGGPNWTNKTGWEDGVAGYDYNYCDWYGINCNLNEEITSINLGQNNLIGTLNNSIDQFNKLDKLYRQQAKKTINNTGGKPYKEKKKKKLSKSWKQHIFTCKQELTIV